MGAFAVNTILVNTFYRQLVIRTSFSSQVTSIMHSLFYVSIRSIRTFQVITRFDFLQVLRYQFQGQRRSSLLFTTFNERSFFSISHIMNSSADAFGKLSRFMSRSLTLLCQLFMYDYPNSNKPYPYPVITFHDDPHFIYAHPLFQVNNPGGPSSLPAVRAKSPDRAPNNNQPVRVLEVVR